MVREAVVHVGSQLTAPEGFHGLEKSTVYHFLRSDAKRDRVLLVRFVVADERPQAWLAVINRAFFEGALLGGQIIASEKQAKRPPWLESLGGVSLSQRDQQRSGAKISHQERVNKRYDLIKPLLGRFDEILGAADPEREINRFARACEPKQCESRIRLWFYTMLCFGNDTWNLMPPFHNIGKWDRQAHAGQKFGRPSPNGALHGFACDQAMIEKIRASYLKFCGLGVYMREIYSRAMIETFGCRVRTDSRGQKSYWHPEGRPYPSFDQYCYHVIGKFGRDQVSRTLYGDTRVRTRLAASAGKYSAAVANLLEQIEADGYYLKETPRGLIEGSSLPPLCVVRSRDLASGRCVGIGFAFGRENSTAYRMMLFSMAIGLKRFGALFGLDVADEDGASIGLPRLPIVDRGPGAKQNLAQNYEKLFPIREMAPSYSGQSKATVESSHPRSMKTEGAPSYIQSDLDPVELAKREIERLIRDNQATDASDRMTPEMYAIPPSPNAVWNYLDQRGRVDAQSVAFDEAVRAFLTPIEVTARNDGVYFNEMRFDSPALRETGVIDRVARSQVATIQGYVLDLCVRHLWLEIEGYIIQVDAQMPLRDDDRQLYLSLPELVALAKTKRAVHRQFQEHQLAATSEYQLRTAEAIGRKPNSGRRQPGCPKTKTIAARQETADLAAYTSKAKKTA